MNNDTPSTAPAPTSAKLLDELQALVAQAETLIGDSVTEHSEEAMGQLRTRFAAIQERAAVVFASVRHKVVAGARCTDTTIRENPYQSLAVAAGVGLLVGVLLGRRSR